MPDHELSEEQKFRLWVRKEIVEIQETMTKLAKGFDGEISGLRRLISVGKSEMSILGTDNGTTGSKTSTRKAKGRKTV